MGGILWRVAVVGGLAVTLAVVLTGCTGADPDRFVKPGAPKVSPSGVYTAAVDAGPNQNGVDTWVAVILDDTGAEVFHDDYAYSTRHGAGITWLSTSDQLWLLSADIGAAHVDRHPDGTWTKTAITPETNDSVPSEIRELMDA